jgi:hypothetical protein
MKSFALYSAFVVAASVFVPQLARAHGLPIMLGTDGTSLTIGGGVSGGTGYASRIFVQTDNEGGATESPGELPVVGNIYYWEIPGLRMDGLNTESSLSMEVLARTPRCCSSPEPLQDRILWYWNPQDGVGPAAMDMHLLGTGPRVQTMSPSDTETLPPFLLVNQVGGTAAQGGQQGFHNHDLLTYAIDNNDGGNVETPAAGAYGFFARLTSDHYAASAPFLIVLNFGVNPTQMSEAASAINLAAADPLPGDFNRDCVVDAADYVIWRKTLGTPSEYAAWQANFGTSVDSESGTGDSLSFNTPEPTASLLLASAAAALLGANARRPRYFFRARRLASRSLVVYSVAPSSSVPSSVD